MSGVLVVMKYSGEIDKPGMEYEASCSMEVGRFKFHVGNMADCSEDANLGRDLKFFYSLPDLISAAWAAGKAGELLDIEKIPNAWDE